MQTEIETFHYNFRDTIEEHVKNLEYVIRPINEHPEGNSFYHHSSFNRYPELLNKQKNLVWCGSNVKTKLCEIGFNGGHSAMLLLLGTENRNIQFQVFDIGEHNYVNPCLQYIKHSFSNANINLVEGDSRLTIPNYICNNPSEVQKKKT